MGFDFSKLNNVKKDKFYQEGKNDVYYKSLEDSHQSNSTIWSQVQSVANDNMNRFNNISNSRNMLYNNQSSPKETIWDKLNNWVFGNSSTKKKDNKELSYNFQNNREESKNQNQDLLQRKYNIQQSPMIFSEQEKQAIPIKEYEKPEKNNSIWQDIVDVAGLVGLGSSTGAKEVLNTIESTNEKRFSNYKNLKKQQFLTSQNVSEEDKMIARNQGNLLLQKNGINTDKKIETNLVKKAIRDSITRDEEEIATKTNRIANKGMKKLADIAPSMGQMLPGMVLNAVNPMLGTSYFTTSASGGYINDGLRRGMTEDEAWNYGMVMGTLEGVSDSFITGQQFNKVANAFGGKQVSKKILDSYGFNMFENAIQEAVMEPAQEITAGIVGGQNKADWSNISSRMLEAGFNGALMGAITNGVTYGLEKTGVVYNKIKNKEKVTANEYKEVIQENINKFGKESVEEAMRQGAMETYQELSNVMGLSQNVVESRNDMQAQQITQEQNKMIQNGNRQIDNNLAKNQQILYNNNESVGGINGQSQFTNKQETFKQSNEQKQPEQRESIWEDGYKQNEQRGVEGFLSEYRGRKTNDGRYEGNLERQQEINYIRNTNNHIKELNDIQKNIKSRYEKIGVPVNFYSLDNKNAGKYDNGMLYINTYNMSDIEQSNVATHEYAHHLLRNDRNFQSEISTIADKIIENEISGNSEAIRNYIMQRNENINIENLDVVQELAIEEILADYMIDIENKVDFTEYNQYEIDTEILNEYSNIVKKYLPENIQNATEGQLNKIEANVQSLGYKPEIEGKQRKHYKSILESDQVGKVGKEVAEKLLESDTYTPISNVDTLSKANENINRNGADDTYIAFRNKINSNERVTLQDIATGERLIQIFSQNGDMEKVNGLIQDVAILGTELGQQVQAMSLIKKASPEGQLMYLNKIVERTNAKQKADLKVTDEMSQKILKAKNQTELDDVMTDIAVELGEQLPISVKDKVRSWRYLSMLGNPKTHIKNLGANVFMNITQQVKNKVGGAIEDVVGITNKNLERTKTLKPANKEQRNFAKQDAEYMKDKIDGGGKYDIKNAIQSNQKQFDNKVLNAVANFNSDMLELEDTIFLKKAYQQALQNYMSANKLTRSDMQDSSILQKAREYASFQAQEATFHQFNSLAQRLTEVENKGGIAGKALEAILPFKKTPMNIAKEGIEYSPIGLAKSLTYDIAQIGKKAKDYKVKLENGTITEADYKAGVSNLITKTIDSTAKGLTGTSLAILGYALADMGMLKSGNDGEDDEFKEQLGEQEYAIRIEDNTYTLDWISPSAIPMFIGSTVHDLIHFKKEDNSNILNSLMTSSAKAFEPMTDMSMLQGLTSAISSYEQGSSTMLFDLGASAVSSYLGQFVPTALGQVAKTMDDKERDTGSTEKGLAKKVDQFKKQQMAKIPVVSKMLPVRKDVWGNEKVRDSNVLVRAYEVGLAPYNRKKVVEDYTERELLKVFDDTGERAVLPGIPNKDITINQQKYRLTAQEYNKAKESFGKTSKSMLDSLVKMNEYKNLSNEQKAEAINNIYSYAKEKIKVDYAKSKGKNIETTTLYNTLMDLKENGENQSGYLSYVAKTEGIEKQKEKIQILSNSNCSQVTKSIIYRNTTGKEDELYNNALSKTNIDIDKYLKYKLQDFESDKEDDGTTSGKSVSGSKKKKVFSYVDDMKLTEDQRLILLGSQYKLDFDERTELAYSIKKLPNQTDDEKMKLYEKMKGFTVYKDGEIDW